MAANATVESQGKASKERRWAPWIGRVALGCVTAALVVAGTLWWRERPLAEAEESLKQGDARYAHFLAAKFLDDRPQHPRAMALKARALVQLGRPDEALALFDQIGAATAEDLHAWARAVLMTEQWSLAVPLLERVVQMEPENWDALYELTAARVRLGRLEEALESARRFAQAPGQEARGQMFVGAILGDLGKDAEAAEAFRRVLRYDPKAEKLQTPASEFFLQYGQVLLRLGKAEEALEPLKLSAAAQETPAALYELGNAAKQLQRPENAKAAWKRALELDPRHVEAREAMARAALEEEQAEQALEWLSPLPEEESTLESAYLRQRAHTLVGDDEKARRWQDIAADLREKREFEAEIEHLLRDAPQSFWARAARAHRFAEQGNWRQAELLVDGLLKEAPGEPFIIELAGAVHRRRELPSLESLPITHF
ncbi:MAG: tetratricopeptide repeat protein [Planctomycetes bacterium]|nr:tetratricopeptide repeat protein [Planctomycetota bacterium]